MRLQGMRRLLNRAGEGSAGGSGGTVLDAARIDQIATQLEQAATRLGETRKEMAEAQQQIAPLVDRVKKLEQDGERDSAAYREAQDALKKLADRVEQLAAENTNLLAVQRRSSSALAQSGARPDMAYRHRAPGVGDKKPRGTLFASRQQAVELGMFFLATMKQSSAHHAGRYARRWLKERKNDLRYLPSIPQSFISDLGADFDKLMQRCYSEGLSENVMQDFAGSVTPGSILVSPEFANTFIRNVEEYGVFRQNALVWPMGSDTVYIPRRKGGLTVYWLGESAAGSETDPDIDQIRVDAKKAMMLHQFSNELAEDENAAIMLADLIMAEFALAVAQEEDDIGFNGDGTSTYAGFVGVLGAGRQTAALDASSPDLNKCISVTGAAGNNLTSEITVPKLREMGGALHTWARAGAKWYINRTVIADIEAIETTGGGPILRYDEANVARMFGYPVVPTEAMPVSPSAASTPVLALGDLSKAWVLGDRRSPTLETSEHYAFNTDQMTLRMSMRAGFKPLQANSMVVYVTGTA